MRMTKAQLAQHAKLVAAKDAASNAVYASVYPRNDIPFNQCYERASNGVRLAYHSAVKALDEFQHEMVTQGRAWFASFGMFTPNLR